MDIGWILTRLLMAVCYGTAIWVVLVFCLVCLVMLLSLPEARREAQALEQFKNVVVARGWQWEPVAKGFLYRITGYVGAAKWSLQAEEHHLIFRWISSEGRPFPGHYHLTWWADNIHFPREIVYITPNEPDMLGGLKRIRDTPSLQSQTVQFWVDGIAKITSLSTAEAKIFYDRIEDFRLGRQEFQTKYIIAATNQALAERVITPAIQEVLIDSLRLIGLGRWPHIVFWWGGIYCHYFAFHAELDVDKISAIIETGLRLIESVQTIEGNEFE